MKLVNFSLVAALLLSLVSPAAAQEQPTEMTQERYLKYLEQFNAGDEHYADIYDDNVIFYHAPQFGVLRGKQAILDLYRKIWQQVKETVTARTVVVDPKHGLIAAELSTKLVATGDEVKMPSGVLNRGDVLISEGTVYYELKNGRIALIRSSIEGARVVRKGATER